VEVLNEAGVQTRIYVVGGAALTLGYGAREATRDVDASISNADGVRPYIVSVARELELPSDWLNDKALGFISQVHDDPTPMVLIDEKDVVVTVASSEALLAMKIRASRGRLDIGDIEFLLRAVGVTTVKSAVALYETYYPEDPLKPQAIPMLQAILDER
jgi:Nucleotidyltransferase of unknown function (DUF6036)